MGGRLLTRGGLLLDTCAAIWLYEGDPIADDAREAIEKARRGVRGVYVSTITAWEIATLVALDRITLSMEPGAWFDRLTSEPRVHLAELTPAILVASATLPGVPPRDPADRIIIATARDLGLTIVTRDRKILDYGAAGTASVLPC